MKKLAFSFISFFLVLASAILLYYDHWRSERRAEEGVPYVPQSASLVYDIANFGKQWKYFRQTPIAKSMSSSPILETIQQTIFLAEELAGNPNSLDEVPITCSVHGLDGEQPAYIFYFDTRHAATQALSKAVLSKISTDKSYSKVDKKYAGYKITTICKQDVAEQLSYICHDQYIIASFSFLLAKEVAKMLASKRPDSFLSLKKTPNSQGSLYVNFGQLPQLLKIFFNHDQAAALSTSLANFAHSGQLNVFLNQHHLLLNGFVQDQASSTAYLTGALAGQTTRGTLLSPYVPQNTAFFHCLTCNDVGSLMAAMQLHRKQKTTGTLKKSADLLAATLDSLLRGKIGHCTLATGKQSKVERLVLMKVTSPSTFVEALKGENLLTTTLSHLPGLTTGFYKLKSDYFQSWLIGCLFPTFDAKYLTHADDCVVFANSQAALQNWYTQFQQNKTWAHTSTKSTWLENTLDQAQLGLFVDLQKAWPQMMHALKPTWKQVFENHLNALQDFSYASLQLFYEPNTEPYVNILLKHKEVHLPRSDSARQKTTLNKAESLKMPAIPAFFQTDARIIHAPWLVKSHRSKGYHVLLQDALYQLYLIDPTGKLIWKKMLEGPITTDVFEVDFYKNNKIQYVFGTDSQLHLVDYHGSEVSKYPHNLPQLSTHLKVIDYDHSKDYRLLIATAQGDVYLKDKQYRPLPAWDPKALGNALTSTPFHIRVQGKDYFLALQTNGVLQALNRKGQYYPGFPVDLNSPVHSLLLVHKGQTAPETTLLVLTEMGKLVYLNLAGHIQKILQLNGHQVVICPSRTLSGGHVVVSREADRVMVIDAALNLLFELPYSAQGLLAQYYDLGNGLQFYAFTDPDQQCTYIYDHTGKPLLHTPLQSAYKVALIFSKEKHQLEVYSCDTTQCMKSIIPLVKLIQ